MITWPQIHAIMPFAGAAAQRYVQPINEAMIEFDIATPLRQAAFLAQIAHESGNLNYVREIASGKAYDTGSLAQRLGNTPVADGDGQRYKGRGLIQITGRANYLACSQALYGDSRLLDTPELLEQPVGACRSAGWYWSAHDLNALADAGSFRAITRAINGGFNGLAERLAFYERAKGILGC